MGWFSRVTGAELAPPTVPSESPTVAVDQTEALTMAVSAVADHRDREKIRELLRLEFECAADSSLRKGNLTAAKILRKLARTTWNVEVNVLYVYAQLLDDISAPPKSSDELRRIGVEWFPRNAAEYIERLASARENARASVRDEY